MSDPITATFTPAPDFREALDHAVRQIIREEIAEASETINDTLAQLILGDPQDEAMAYEINDQLDAEARFTKRTWQGTPVQQPKPLGPRGIDLEITERADTLDGKNIAIPNSVRINGQEVLIPEGKLVS